MTRAWHKAEHLFLTISEAHRFFRLLRRTFDLGPLGRSNRLRNVVGAWPGTTIFLNNPGLCAFGSHGLAKRHTKRPWLRQLDIGVCILGGGHLHGKPLLVVQVMYPVVLATKNGQNMSQKRNCCGNFHHAALKYLQGVGSFNFLQLLQLFFVVESCRGRLALLKFHYIIGKRAARLTKELACATLDVLSPILDFHVLGARDIAESGCYPISEVFVLLIIYRVAKCDFVARVSDR